MRNERVDRSPELAQGEREQAGRRHAVDVEVSEDGDGLARVERPFETVGGIPHAGDEQGVLPGGVEGGLEKGPRVIGIRMPTGHEDAGKKRSDPQLGCKGALGALVGGQHRPSAALCQAAHVSEPPEPWCGRAIAR